MVLEHLLDSLAQAQTLSDLEHLLDDKTLRGILNSWLFECQQNNYSRRTIEHYQDKITGFLKFLGDKITEPQQLKPLHISLFLLNYRKNHKPASEHGYYRAIHTFCGFMVGKRLLATNPMEGMKPPKVPKVVIIPYNKNQIKDMLELCNLSYEFSHSFTAIRNKAMLLIYLSSGLRKLEMTEIKLDQVNIRERTIKVMGKGAKERYVGFGVQAGKALLEYFKIRNERAKDNCPYLWICEEGTQLGYSGVGLAIYHLKIRANVKVHSSTHALRHAFATQALRNGARPNDIQTLMGHSTPQMTQRYQQTVTSEDSVRQHASFDPVDHWDLH